MDRPVEPNTYGTPEPDRIDPPGGFAQMPESAPDPTQGTAAPYRGDVPPMHAPEPGRGSVPPMSTPGHMQRFDPWNYREGAGYGDGSDLVGFRVEAIDGHIGKIDEASTTVGESYLVVDTGPWIFGHKVLLPAGTVNHIDSLDRKLYVDRTKEQIKHAPEYDPEHAADPAYRDKIQDYYHTTYSLGDVMPPARPDTEGYRPGEDPNFPR
jgi:hypothetical protein